MLLNATQTQLMPFEYPWAWDEFKNLCKNPTLKGENPITKADTRLSAGCNNR